MNFERVVEPYDGKLSCTVLKGGKPAKACLSNSQGFATWKH